MKTSATNRTGGTAPMTESSQGPAIWHATSCYASCVMGRNQRCRFCEPREAARPQRRRQAAAGVGYRLERAPTKEKQRGEGEKQCELTVRGKRSSGRLGRHHRRRIGEF